MLGKINKKMFYDAHFHFSDCMEAQCFDVFDEWRGCSCAHSIEEWNLQFDAKTKGQRIELAFGIHPQQVNRDFNVSKQLDFLESLIMEGKVCAVGETGFDFFTEEYKNNALLQEQVFVQQIDLCSKYDLPVVIHCRKANEKLFEYSNLLKKLPAVLFHSFMGTPGEALSLLRRGINGWFSFGKQMMNNNKKVIACVKELPVEKLLLETDAPFQYLKNESKTFTGEIRDIYGEAVKFRNETDIEKFMDKMEENYFSLFSLK